MTLEYVMQIGDINGLGAPKSNNVNATVSKEEKLVLWDMKWKKDECKNCKYPECEVGDMICYPIKDWED